MNIAEIVVKLYCLILLLAVCAVFYATWIDNIDYERKGGKHESKTSKRK